MHCILFDDQNAAGHKDTSGIKLHEALGSCSTAKQHMKQKGANSHLCSCFSSIHSNHLRQEWGVSMTHSHFHVTIWFHKSQSHTHNSTSYSRCSMGLATSCLKNPQKLDLKQIPLSFRYWTDSSWCHHSPFGGQQGVRINRSVFLENYKPWYSAEQWLCLRSAKPRQVLSTVTWACRVQQGEGAAKQETCTPRWVWSFLSFCYCKKTPSF